MKNRQTFIVRPAEDADRSWIKKILRERWGSHLIVTRGLLHDASRLTGLVALRWREEAGGSGREGASEGPGIGRGERVGLITYRVAGASGQMAPASCEIVSLDSLAPREGIGTALVERVRQIAAESGCQRLWVLTTNDNTPALRFWQKRGFCLVAVHRNAIQSSRLLKPEIATIGLDGIPIRDEIELEMPLPSR